MPKANRDSSTAAPSKVLPLIKKEELVEFTARPELEELKAWGDDQGDLGAEERQEGPTKKPQEGPEGGSTAVNVDEEKEQRTAGPQDSGEGRKGKEAPAIRAPRRRGGAAGRLWRLGRTHERTWKQRSTKALESLLGHMEGPGGKGAPKPRGSSRGPCKGTAGRSSELAGMPGRTWG